MVEETASHLLSRYATSSHVIEEYFKLHSRYECESEKLALFISSLKQPSIKCKFGTYLERALGEQLVVKLLLVHDKLLTVGR